MLDTTKTKIEIFDSQIKLDNTVVNEMLATFKKPGLVLLSAGRTFEEGIYSKINDYYNCASTKEKKDFVHPELIVSHVDERVTEEDQLLFSKSIQNQLPFLSDQFKPIKMNSVFEDDFINEDQLQNSIKDFDALIKANGGPKTIYLGLGEDPSIAHIAYIGEEGINPTTQRVSLSKGLREKFKIKNAITIGVDIFDSVNLEKIVLVIKGFHKARSLKASFENPNTGFGFLMEHYPEKLHIYADINACKLILNN